MGADGREGQLRRELGFWALAAYGTGDILGAGIYALVGEIAGKAGHAAWISFGITVLIASLTALSYAELSSRFPTAGGEAQFCEKAFRRPAISLVIGFLVLASGVVSLSAVSHAFIGYLLEPLAVESTVIEWLGLVIFLLLLAALNFWGIRQSSIANIGCTLVELGGLLFLIGVGVTALRSGQIEVAQPRGDQAQSWLNILQGSALAFFAFIGFEDMVNVSEEVRNPRRNLPLAIFTALLVAAMLYMVVAWVATSVVPPDVLAKSDAPLWQVVTTAAPWVPGWSFPVVAMFAVANTGLLNFIMGSRLLYGMSRDGLLPASLGTVHRRTQTPYRAILVVLAAAMVLALSGTLTILAGTTNVLLLLVFTTVNLALLVLRRREGPPEQGFRVPLAVPAVGALVSVVLIGFSPWKSLLLAFGLVVAAALMAIAWVWRN